MDMDNDLNSGKELIIRNITIQKAEVPGTDISLYKDASGAPTRREIRFGGKTILIMPSIWDDIASMDLKSPYVDFPSTAGHWYVGLEEDPIHQLCYLFISKDVRYRIPFQIIQKIFL